MKRCDSCGHELEREPDVRRALMALAFAIDELDKRFRSSRDGVPGEWPNRQYWDTAFTEWMRKAWLAIHGEKII